MRGAPGLLRPSGVMMNIERWSFCVFGGNPRLLRADGRFEQTDALFHSSLCLFFQRAQSLGAGDGDEWEVVRISIRSRARAIRWIHVSSGMSSQ